MDLSVYVIIRAGMLALSHGLGCSGWAKPRSDWRIGEAGAPGLGAITLAASLALQNTSADKPAD